MPTKKNNLQQSFCNVCRLFKLINNLNAFELVYSTQVSIDCATRNVM